MRGNLPWASPGQAQAVISFATHLKREWSDWHSKALCATSVGRFRTPIIDPEAFFAERTAEQRGTSTYLTDSEERAKALCARCPVRYECLSAGMYEAHGIWGGTLPQERRRLYHKPGCTPGDKQNPRTHRACWPKDNAVSLLLDLMDAQAHEMGLVAQEVVA